MEKPRMINLEDLKRPFQAKDIEWRIATSGKTKQGKIWAQVLAYISARAIQERLDEVCGPENWKPEYEFVYGKDGLTSGVMCQLSIRIPTATGYEWVTKEDGAEQTDFESFKGGISSALKRAGSAWGIGRYLYDLESAWADIVERDTPGAQYATTKDKVPFHWLAPRLPDWALPEDERKKAAQSANVAPKVQVPKQAEPPAAPAPAVNPAAAPKATASKTGPKSGGITDKQRVMLWARLMKLEYSQDEAKDFMVAHSGKQHSSEWTRADFEKVLGVIENLEKNNPQNRGDAYEGPDTPESGDFDAS